MKTQLGSQWNERLETPIREFWVSAKQRTSEEMKRLHENLRNSAQELLAVGKVAALTQYGDMLVKAESTCDYFLPDEVDGEMEVSEQEAQPTLRRVSDRVSKKLQKRAMAKLAQLGEVRRLTEDRVRTIVPVDLIAYAEEVLNSAKSTAAPRVEQTQTAMVKALEQVQERVSDTRAVLSLKLSQRQQQLEEIPTRARNFATNLRKRLQVAVDRVRALSAHGNNYLGSASLSQLSSDTAKFFTNLTAYELSGEITDPEYEEVITKFD
jgi:ElaB/YqjD/DUF883 family membrane-anchored ribosome-binding protein